MDRRGGEKSLGHAKLGVRLLKETQLVNKLGAEECDLAKYSIQIVRLLPSDDYVLVVNDYEYGLVDEFLRVRMLLDSAGEHPRDMSNKILSFSTLEYYPTSREVDRRDLDYYEEVTRDFVKREYPEQRPKDPFEE